MASVKVSVLEIDGVELEYPEERLLDSLDTRFNNAGTSLVSTNAEAAIKELALLLGGDLALKPTFRVYAKGIAIGSNKSMLSLMNGSATPLKLKIQEIHIFNTQTTPVTGVVAEFSLLRMTGHSVGTVITPLANDSDDTLNANVSARTGATISGENSALLQRWLWSSDEWGVGTNDVESNDHAIGQMISDSPTPNSKAVTLNAGQGVTIKQLTNSTAGTFDLLIVFTQE